MRRPIDAVTRGNLGNSYTVDCKRTSRCSCLHCNDGKDIDLCILILLEVTAKVNRMKTH